MFSLPPEHVDFELSADTPDTVCTPVRRALLRARRWISVGRHSTVRCPPINGLSARIVTWRRAGVTTRLGRDSAGLLFPGQPRSRHRAGRSSRLCQVRISSAKENVVL